MLFLNRKKFKPLTLSAQLTLMDDESLSVIGISKTGFVISAPIEKLSYYFNYDKKVEALLRVYGQSFYICLSLHKLSSSNTLAKVDLKRSNPFISAIFLGTQEKNIASIKQLDENIIILADGRRFDISKQLTKIPKNSLITFCFMNFLKEDKKSADIVSFIDKHYSLQNKDGADFAA